jgi:hypothetical protein
MTKRQIQNKDMAFCKLEELLFADFFQILTAGGM